MEINNALNLFVLIDEQISTPDLLEKCWRFFVLGIVQGLSEFLPISSTAHLKAIPTILGWGDPGVAVTAVIQLGSILAVIAYFWSDLKNTFYGVGLAVAKGQWHQPKARLGLAIYAGTLPIILAGMTIKLFWKNFNDSSLRSFASIGFISIIMAIFLAIAEKRNKQFKSLKNTSLQEGLLIGFSQMFALIPGVSRSGITLSTALLNGWKRQDAARFSFLLGIPAITIAGLVELKNSFHNNFNEDIIPLLVGIITASIISWITIDWLLKYLQSNDTWIFIIYRLIFGFALIFYWWQNSYP